MKRDETFYKIVLDNTWALWDSPNTYSVSISRDGLSWGEPVAIGLGRLGITTIVFPPRTGRFIRITQTGKDPVYSWSIYELDVYRKKAR